MSASNAHAHNPGVVTNMKNRKKFSRPTTKFRTSGVTRRTVAFVVVVAGLLYAGWLLAYNMRYIVGFVSVNGGWVNLGLTILATIGTLTVVGLFIWTPAWLKNHPSASKGLVVLAVVVALIFGNAILAAFLSGWLIMVTVLVALIVIVLMWALVAGDLIGWLRNKTTR